jgi:hypothetical protein
MTGPKARRLTRLYPTSQTNEIIETNKTDQLQIIESTSLFAQQINTFLQNKSPPFFRFSFFPLQSSQ